MTTLDDAVRLADTLAQRLQIAMRLLQWWDATNPPDDRETKLARDTRAFLAGVDIELPPSLKEVERNGPWVDALERRIDGPTS
jgi:hypothetical protein